MHDDTTPDDATPTDVATPEFVVAEIAAAADAVDVGDAATMFATVQTTVRRRRRQRNAVVGLAAAGALLVSGAAIGNLVGGDDGDDLLVSTPATDTPTTEAAEVEDDVGTPPPTEVADGSVETVEVIEVPGTEVVGVRLVPARATDVVDSGLTIDVNTGGQTRLFAWRDGFLSIRTTFEPQPLPTELPQEIVDRFPPEVVELFPDGLPPTINEAIEVLQEAGLFDEVSDVVTANQEVYDAIYAEQGDVDTTVRYSTDGVEWTDVPFDFPVVDNYWSFAATTSDRMVIVVDSGLGAPGLVTDEQVPPRVVEVHSSTDLVDWTSQTIPLPDPPGDLSPTGSLDSSISSVAVTETGFIVATQSASEVDPVQLVPQEVRDRLLASGGYGTGYGEDGVTIEVFGDGEENPDSGQPSGPVEVLTFTWEELGLDGPPNDGRPSSTTYVSTWGGEPTVIDDGPSGWLVGVGDHFVELGPDLRRSTNGVDWTSVAVPGDGFVDGIIETAHGVAIRMTDQRGGQTVYEGDLASGEWTPIELPDVPGNLATASWGSHVFLLAQYGDDAGIGPDPVLDSIGSRQIAEVDGYRYEFELIETAEEYLVSYTLTDVATGDVVVTESADGPSEEDDPFEYVQDGFGGSGLTILDPATGEALVSIPFESMTMELIKADGTTLDVTEPPREPAEPILPSHWVMASVGDGWMVEQISDGSVGPEEGRWPNGVSVAGDVVLVAWSDGTFTRVVPA